MKKASERKQEISNKMQSLEEMYIKSITKEIEDQLEILFKLEDEYEGIFPSYMVKIPNKVFLMRMAVTLLSDNGYMPLYFIHYNRYEDYDVQNLKKESYGIEAKDVIDFYKSVTCNILVESTVYLIFTFKKD